MRRGLRAALLLLVIAGSFLTGRIVRLEEARAAVRVTSSDPRVFVDSSLMEGDLAAFVKAQGITTQAGWVTFVNNLSAAQLLSLEKARLAREVQIVP